MAPRPTSRLGRYSEHLVPECRVSSEEAIRRLSPSRDRTGCGNWLAWATLALAAFLTSRRRSIARGTRAMRKPATIETWVDGLYICIRQPNGFRRVDLRAGQWSVSISEL
jgi:hypothetical protein